MFFLRDAAGQALDVALEVPGEPLLEGLRLTVWPLWWQRLEIGMTSLQVTVPLELMDDADVTVRGVLITLPAPWVVDMTDAVVHVHTAYGTARLPEAGVAQLSTDAGSLLLRLDGSRLQRGMYLIRFQMARPDTMPSLNLWQVALCSETLATDTDRCNLQRAGAAAGATNVRGRAVLTVFALAGFNPTAQPSRSLPAVTAAADLKMTRVAGLPGLLSLVALLNTLLSQV